MKRGTTPYFTMTIEGYDLTDKTVYATIGQSGLAIVKSGEDLQVSYNSTDDVTTIVMLLSQKDTLQLQKGTAYVEVKFIDEDGIVKATETEKLTVVENTLLEKRIAFVEV